MLGPNAILQKASGLFGQWVWGLGFQLQGISGGYIGGSARCLALFVVWWLYMSSLRVPTAFRSGCDIVLCFSFRA